MQTLHSLLLNDSLTSYQAQIFTNRFCLLASVALGAVALALNFSIALKKEVKLTQALASQHEVGLLNRQQAGL